jgi:hypothetical protein
MIIEGSPHLGIHIEDIGWLYMHDEASLIMDALSIFNPNQQEEKIVVEQLGLTVFLNQSKQAVAFKIQKASSADNVFQMFEQPIFSLAPAEAISVIQDRNFNQPIKLHWFTRLDVGLNANPDDVLELTQLNEIESVIFMYKGFCNEQL